MTISSGDMPVMNLPWAPRKPRVTDISSPQFLPETIASLARVRLHLSNGRIAVAAEMLKSVEGRLDAYNKLIMRRTLPRG